MEAVIEGVVVKVGVLLIRKSNREFQTYDTSGRGLR